MWVWCSRSERLWKKIPSSSLTEEGRRPLGLLFVPREGRRPVVSFLVARSDPRGPRRGWRGKCGARPGAQRGPLAGREGRCLASIAPEFALSRLAVPLPQPPRALLPGRHSSPPPSVLGTESRRRILRDQEAPYRRPRCQTT